MKKSLSKLSNKYTQCTMLLIQQNCFYLLYTYYIRVISTGSLMSKIIYFNHNNNDIKNDVNI